MTINKLLPQVSLPYRVVSGSFEYRQNKAQQFTHKIINDISGVIGSEGITISKLNKLIKHLLPRNLVFSARKIKVKNTEAQLSRVFSDRNFVVEQVLEIKPDENGLITLFHIPEIAHEIRHLADSLFHPKFLLRDQSIAQKIKFLDKYGDFYDKNVYVKEIFFGKKDKIRILKQIRHQIRKALRGLKIEDKINLLQEMRYNLISERNAYKAGSKTAKKIFNKNIPVYEDALYNPSKEFMFNEKIKLLETIIYEMISKERGIHKAKLKNQARKISRNN